MILPIVAYGDPVLKREADEIESDFPQLNELIDNMFETMYHAQGVGLAAPQIAQSIRLFVVDTSPFAEDADEIKNKAEREEMKSLDGFKKIFINPIILEESGEEWAFNEGCLSIPGIREDVFRHERITIEYYNEKFELVEEVYDGLKARVIQHEYDHIEGILFTDHLNPLRKQFLKKRLNDISKGIARVDYKMKFPKAKR
ncbi:MAG: peptide deformylase [Salibacteraceae bacterium]|jgi:peptide deformylase|nr:peptide deformylase [Salibacteraceae bacterium]MDP4686094.1 peptide deformylase [Salibacteraceae bacterium]MDP4764583.1 peptide deformylase [Salibacteraceae bacterium]MDP4844415.1 peptide deformylase [Salibacteraceae bacterium]MDP4935209.1 peptide deformylase [Salibacteraceae bacterium]